MGPVCVVFRVYGLSCMLKRVSCPTVTLGKTPLDSRHCSRGCNNLLLSVFDVCKDIFVLLSISCRPLVEKLPGCRHRLRRAVPVVWLDDAWETEMIAIDDTFSQCLLDFFSPEYMTDSILCVDDLLMLCPLEEEEESNDDDTRPSLSECVIEETIDNFPELDLDDNEEYMCYAAAEQRQTLGSLSFEPEGPVSTIDDTKSSTRRRTELDRLARNGWKRVESTTTVLGKRSL